MYSYTREPELLEAAEKAARFIVCRQSSDGSWAYGEDRLDGWVDSFHTGFVLSSLGNFMRYSGMDEFMPCLEKGCRYYRENFFLPDGAPKYYPHRIYPIDVHSLSQAVLTLIQLREVDPAAHELAYRVALWGINNMQDEEGFFHYQIHRFHRIRIPYIRWGQAWMQKALTELLLDSRQEKRIQDSQGRIGHDATHRYSRVPC